MAKKPPIKLPEAERNIYFYRAIVGDPENQSPPKFDHAAVLGHIASLPFTPGGRYLTDQDNTLLVCWPDVQHNNRAVFGRVRRQDIPLLERQGSTREVDLRADEGVLELIHMVFFPNNVVGAEFNFYGPRLPRFGQYVEQRAGDVCKSVEFRHLLKENALSDLKRFEGLKMLELKVYKTQAGVLKGLDTDLDTVMNALRRLNAPETVAVTLQAGRKRDSYLGESLLTGLARLVAKPAYRDAVSIMRVTGRNKLTSELEILDLLKDQLVVRKAILKRSKRSRALGDEATYTAIMDSHSEIRDDFPVLETIG